MDSRKYEKFSNLFFVTKKFKEANLVYHQIKSVFYHIFFEIYIYFLCENPEVGIINSQTREVKELALPNSSKSCYS